MIKVLENSMFEYKGYLVVNPELLNDSDFTKLFDYKTVYIYDKNRDNTDYIINKVIHDIIIDDRFIDIQCSFIKDTRDRRGCTQKQIESLRSILGNNYEYSLNDLQLAFLLKQRRGLIQKLIDTFKDTEFIYWMPGMVTIKDNKMYQLV